MRSRHVAFAFAALPLVGAAILPGCGHPASNGTGSDNGGSSASSGSGPGAGGGSGTGGDSGTGGGSGTGGENTHTYYGGQDQGASWPFGTNTYADPGLASPGALPSAAPDCSTHATTTDCMNAGYKVAASMAPGGGAAGKGYQPPGACIADPYYPAWLKAVVYLSWNGSGLTQSPGLITRPCDL